MLTLVTGITQVKVVIDEEDFMEYLRDVDVETVTLLAVVPASAVEATSSDDYEEIDNIYVYILKKSNPQDLTSDEI